MARSSRRQGSGEEVRAALSGLRKGEVAPVYLLHGSETYLRDEILREIRKAVLGEGSDFNHDVFSWGETPSSDIVSAAHTLPFMAGRRLVEVRGVGQVNDKDADILIPLVENTPPETVLIFIADKADLRRTFFKKIGDSGFSLRMETPGERELPAWMQSQAGGLGFTLTREGALLLTEWVEPSLGRIRSELEKLAAYLAPGEEADAEAVRDLVGRSKVDAMYKLGDVLAEGNAPQALSLVRDLSDSGPGPQFLVGFLRNQIRRWTITKAAAKRKTGQKELAEMLGVPPFAVDRLRRTVGGVSSRYLRNLYGKLLAVDRQIKRSGRGNAALHALELFIIEMTQDASGFGARSGRIAPGRKSPGAGR
jgi:DNA polymerase-3 subunit delta